MGAMRAVVVDPDVPGRLKVAEVESPTLGPSQALIRVAAVSLNRGELRAATSAEAGFRPGWDVAGTVERPAADGTGPGVGARVCGLCPQRAGWAELAAVSTNALSEIPASVSFEHASTLPVAGLTALRALERGGLLSERAVMITGASGGVGVFACQMAREAGARVVGVVNRPESRPAAEEAGAHIVVVGEDLEPARAHGPFHLVVDSVAGNVLGSALTMLAEQGTCVVLGATGGRETTFDVSRFYNIRGGTLYGFIIFFEHDRDPVAEDLGRLARMVASGRLRPQISLEASLDDIASVAQKLMDRHITGKAVLRVP